MLQNKISKGSNLRWEGSRIMLPEHVQELRKRKFEQTKVAKHELDEQELQELGFVVIDSLKHELEVKVTYLISYFYYPIDL
ncbi:YolD-like family protein [Halalkalibacter lacteus]|uniref:YolD-like family protein n=1 Tax=Halalkalibacter lacteus TaxID=3090663 RepID=UPI002FCC6E48